MWDKRSPALRKLRPALGGAALAVAIVMPFFFSASNPTMVLANAGEATEMLTGSREDQLRQVDVGEEDPELFGNALIYRERDDGTGEIVGTLEVVDGQLFAHVKEAYREGYELRWYAPVKTLDEGIGLIFGAEEMQREIKALENELVPVVNTHILPPLMAVLRTEFDRLINETLEQEQGELEAIAEEIAEKMAPEIDELSNQLVETAWDKIGVWGVAEGLWRKGSSALGSAAKGAWKWGKGLFGGDDEDEEENTTEFLSDERKKELRLAIEEDIAEFWDENSVEIMEKGKEVVGSRKDLLDRLESRVTQQFGDAAVEVIREEAHHVQAPLTNFANDVGLRHLVTEKGSPRLAMAYAIRSGTGLTGRPLVVLKPSQDGSSMKLRKFYVQDAKASNG